MLDQPRLAAPLNVDGTDTEEQSWCSRLLAMNKLNLTVELPGIYTGSCSK